MKDSTRADEIPELIQTLFQLLEVHRKAFHQERPYQRAAGLVLGELFNFGRQTVTQELMALGMVGEDWSAWYRLFSRKRFEEEELAGCLLGDTLEMWRRLPERTVLLTRTARNRCLFYLPTTEANPGPGRPPCYGERAPHPADWLHAGLRRWPTQWVQVRGRSIRMRYQVLGPFVREGIPERPLFLIVSKGFHRLLSKPGNHYKHRKPSFFLVSAVQQEGRWQLPFPIETLLSWIWQRWEIEVAHREMKSGLGIGEKQCWNPRSAVLAVQWSVWSYALLLLAGYRTWGLCGGPPARWWPGARRWSFNTLWRSYRAALWANPEFRACWTPSPANWWKNEAWLTGLSNACLASARI